MSKPSKYRAKPIVIDGIRFASQKEGARYRELLLLASAGELWDLELQPRYPLCVPSTTGTIAGALKAASGGFSGRIGEYRADFTYLTTKGRVVEDVKGFRTPLYRWKKRHVEQQYGIRVVEV